MLSVLLNITYAAAIGLSFYSIGWLLHRGNKNQVTISFILCQALIILWCTTQFFIPLQLTELQRMVIYDVGYLGICLIGPSWLLFSLFYGEKRTSPCLIGAVYAPAVFHYVILLTNSAHHLFYSAFERGELVYAPLFYTNAAYSYLCVLGGAMILWHSLGQNPANRSQIKAIMISVSIPLIFNTLYLAGWIAPGFDITPPAFSLTSLLLLRATYRYNFLNVNTLATNQVFETISEGILIYNTAGKITYSNQTAQDLFHMKKGDDIQSFYDQIPPCDREAYEAILMLGDGLTVEFKKQIHLDKKGRMTAGTVVLSDVSKYYELMDRTRELAASNELLAVEKEQNRIAQDIHDTTGHTLTMIRSLMKLAKIEYERGDSTQLEDYLEQAQKLSAEGLCELRCSINNLKHAGGSELVSQSLKRLAESVREVEVELCVQGSDNLRYCHLSGIVYECAREAVTNCLKYAHATHMDIILKFHEESLDLYIFDNGVGCGNIISGNGLEGMEKRVREAGGQFRTVSSEGEGFQITIKLPAGGSKKEILR